MPPGATHFSLCLRGSLLCASIPSTTLPSTRQGVFSSEIQHGPMPLDLTQKPTLPVVSSNSGTDTPEIETFTVTNYCNERNSFRANFYISTSRSKYFLYRLYAALVRNMSTHEDCLASSSKLTSASGVVKEINRLNCNFKSPSCP